MYTEVPEKLNGFIKQQQRWKKGTLRANLFASTFVWSKNNPIVSLIFYAGFALGSITINYDSFAIVLHFYLTQYFISAIFGKWIFDDWIF